MDVSSVLTNDQVAVLGCFVAIAVCGLVAALSFRLGPAGHQAKTQKTILQLNSARTEDKRAAQDRRAA